MTVSAKVRSQEALQAAFDDFCQSRSLTPLRTTMFPLDGGGAYGSADVYQGCGDCMLLHHARWHDDVGMWLSDGDALVLSEARLRRIIDAFYAATGINVKAEV